MIRFLNKIHRTLLLMLLLQAGTPIFSQDMVTLDVHTFKEEGDSLHVGYRLGMPSHVVKSSQGLRICPMVQSGDSVLMLPSITVLGKNKYKVLERYHNNSGLQYPPLSMEPGEPFDYQVRVPYREWMDSARLYIRQEVAGYRASKVVTRYSLAGKVELEVREPYRVNPAVSFILPQKEEKRRRRQGKAYLDFQVGRSVIIPSFRRNPEELQKIDEALREVVNNKDAVLLGLYIEGFASPDGAYATNERLSRERAAALKEYMKNKFALSENLFKVSSIAEDWEGLKVLVEASDLPEKDKVVNIISTIGIDDGREGVLMKFAGGVPYRKMLKDMFPELRRVEYQIDYSVKDYDIRQTKELLDKNPSDLSQYELYNLALSMEKDSKQYKDIFLEIIPRQFADDATAHNNAAAVLIANGETATAKRHLEKAGDSAQALNNLGILSMLEGDLEKAAAYFDKAEKGGNEEAARNKKEVETKRRDNIKMERYKNRK